MEIGLGGDWPVPQLLGPLAATDRPCGSGCACTDADADGSFGHARRDSSPRRVLPPPELERGNAKNAKEFCLGDYAETHSQEVLGPLQDSLQSLVAQRRGSVVTKLA